MRLLIIHNQIGLGGIETQLLQLLPQLKKRGYIIDMLLIRASLDMEVSRRFESYAKLFYLSPLEQLPIFQRYQVEDHYDIIFCTGWRAFLQGVRLKQRLDIGAKLCVGLYHPREFCLRGKWIARYNAGIKTLLFELPANNMAFMLESFLNDHNRFFSLPASRNVIFSIGVSLEQFNKARKAVKKNKIISVGRIVNFKRYHFAMIQIIHSLLNDGFDFEYHLYGYGELEGELRRNIQEAGVGGHYFIHGALEHSRLPEIFTDAFLFIGLGAALIEACASGVPSLIAIESNSDGTCYGLFHEQNDYNIGESDPQRQRFDIKEKIIELSKLDNCSYQAVGEDTKNRASQFSIEALADRLILFWQQTKKFEITVGYRFWFLDMLLAIKWRLLSLAGKTSPSASRYEKGY